MKAQDKEIKINKAKEELNKLHQWQEHPQTLQILEFLDTEVKTILPGLLEPIENEHHRELQSHQKGEVRGMLQIRSSIKQRETDLLRIINGTEESKEKPINPVRELLEEGYDLLNLT